MYLQNVFQGPVSYVHTWVIHISPFHTTYRRCDELSAGTKAKESAQHLGKAQANFKFQSENVTREDAKRRTCLLGLCRLVLGCFTAQGVSNTTVTSKVAGCIETLLLVLNCLAGTLAAGSHPHTDRAVQVTFTAHCTQAKLQYSKFGYICINVILNWHNKVPCAKECPAGSACKSELRYCHRLMKFICQNAFQYIDSVVGGRGGMKISGCHETSKNTS